MVASGNEIFEADHFRRQLGEWLTGAGPESDIVMSTRVRLARNLLDFPFLTKASQRQRTEIEKLLHDRIDRARIAEQAAEGGDGIVYANLQETTPLDRLCLVERHLISKDLASGEGDRGVALGRRETVSIMVNEEDHLRIQVLRSGFQPDEAWGQISDIDDRLERVLNYAFSPQFGYLTACPTNCGTGLRVSVMLHLPALVMTKQIDKVFQAVSKINLAVRGFYGEGTQASGDFYQISNQVTLGRGEAEVLRQLKDVVPQIIKYERSIRDTLIAENKKTLEDRVWRAYGMLRSARTITSEETMDLLSAVRMGVNLGLIQDLKIGTVNELFIQTQPAHLQKLEGRKLESPERDIARASFIRGRLEHLN
ncbi:MAG TPA: protein arginine kinase [Planctomycetota bacterium]|nr:protein arginine kinase [Planctomycetota bacterium]